MKAFIKPREIDGAPVRVCYPRTARALEPAGRLFPDLQAGDLTYWRRRERDGDVTITEPAEPAAPRSRGRGPREGDQE